MKKNIIIEAISILLILLFVYTGVSKMLTLYNFHRQLLHQPLTKDYASFLMIAVPLTELLIAACLLIPRFRKWGLYGSLILMGLFTTYVGYMIYIWPHNTLPCSCGGIIKQLTWRQHLVFNSIFTLLALTGILLSKNSSGHDKNASVVSYG